MTFTIKNVCSCFFLFFFLLNKNNSEIFQPWLITELTGMYGPCWHQKWYFTCYSPGLLCLWHTRSDFLCRDRLCFSFLWPARVLWTAWWYSPPAGQCLSEPSGYNLRRDSRCNNWYWWRLLVAYQLGTQCIYIKTPFSPHWHCVSNGGIFG